MCAPLANKNAFNPCAADRTFLIRTCVDPKIILELAAPVDPVEGGTVAADALI